MSSKKVQFSEVVIQSTDNQVFNTSKEALTPSISRSVKYKHVNEREQTVIAPQGTLSRPNYEDILRRVSVVVHQHIAKCEARLEKATPETYETGLFHRSQMLKFSEENFISPQYVYQFVRAPLLLSGFLYGIRKVEKLYTTPSLSEVHDFLVGLFVGAQLTAECSIGM